MSFDTVIPVFNCAKDIARHIDSMRLWLGLAENVIVVDSGSTDGTVKLLKSQLSHPRLRFIQHPPGLYESWNFALSECTSEFVYIATAGDEITPEGLRHLLRAAEEFNAEIVISPPRMTDVRGCAIDIEWPIHKWIQLTNCARPRSLDFLGKVCTTCLFGEQSILGSSASNLYRTRILQRNPFPTDFGKAGDSAWACQHIWRARVVVVPFVCASFVHADPGIETSDVAHALRAKRLNQLAIDSLAGISVRGRKSDIIYATLIAHSQSAYRSAILNTLRRIEGYERDIDSFIDQLTGNDAS